MQSQIRATLQSALFGLRLLLGLYIALIGLMKIGAPAPAGAIFETFYHLQFSAVQIMGIGGAQFVLGTAIMTGTLRPLTYGLGLFTQAAATLAHHAPILTAFAGDNHLYLAMLPLTASFALLFALREEDKILSVDVMIASERRRKRR